MNDKITMIARQATPITAMAPVTRSAPALPCAKAQPPAKSAAPHAIIKHHSVTPKLKDGLGICMRESDLRRNRPPNLCPKPGLGPVRSKLRRISSISRSYLLGIVVLFLELASILLLVMIPTSQGSGNSLLSQFYHIPLYNTKQSFNFLNQAEALEHRIVWRDLEQTLSAQA